MFVFDLVLSGSYTFNSMFSENFFEMFCSSRCNSSRFHFIFPVLLSFDGRIELFGFHDFPGVDAPFGVSFMDIAKRAALAVFMTATPRIPDSHSFHLGFIIHNLS